MTTELCAGSTTLPTNAQCQRTGEIPLKIANKNKGRIQELQEPSTSSHTIKGLVRFRNLIEALDAAPANRPFVTAWIDEDERETLTFSEFRRRSGSSAAVLRDHGVTVGDRVVIIMPQGIPAMTTFVGTMMLGAVPTFLAYPNFKIEPSKYRSGLAGVTANLKARVVVIDKEFPDEMLGHVLLRDGTKLLRAGKSEDAGIEPQIPPLEMDAESLAFIQHSAGTTGLQKGVALTHAAVLRQLEHLARALRIDAPTDHIYSWLPLYHDMGLIACFMLPMVCHIPVVMQSPLDWVMHPKTMLQIMSEYQCTLAWLPNFAFQFVPRRTPPSGWAQYDLSFVAGIDQLLRAGPRQQHAASFRRRLRRWIESRGACKSSYAMAENVFAVTQSTLIGSSGPARVSADGQQFRSCTSDCPGRGGTPGSVSFTSSGRLLPNHEVRIVSDSGEVLATDHVGEILIKSDCLFDGYYNRPDLTAQAMVEGWYHTGDLGFCWTANSYVVGRKKDLLIIGGENIYPAGH